MNHSNSGMVFIAFGQFSWAYVKRDNEHISSIRGITTLNVVKMCNNNKIFIRFTLRGKKKRKKLAEISNYVFKGRLRYIDRCWMRLYSKDINHHSQRSRWIALRYICVRFDGASTVICTVADGLLLLASKQYIYIWIIFVLKLP